MEKDRKHNRLAALEEERHEREWAEYEREWREAENRQRDDFLSRLCEMPFVYAVERKEVGQQTTTPLDEIMRRGLDLEVIYQVHVSHATTAYDIELGDLAERRRAASDLARSLRTAATALHSFSSFILLFRTDSAGGAPQFDRFMGSGVPEEWCDPQKPLQVATGPGDDNALLDLFGSTLNPVTRSSPFSLPVALLELFREAPLPIPRSALDLGSARDDVATTALARWREDIERRRAARYHAIDFDDRESPTPSDIHKIADLLKDLAAEASRVSDLLRRPKARSTLHAQKSFRRAFAAHAQAFTGAFHDDVGAAVFSITFTSVEPKEYMRLRERDCDPRERLPQSPPLRNRQKSRSTD
jgi:hypothetical protein